MTSKPLKLNVRFFNTAFLSIPTVALFPVWKGSVFLPVRYGVIGHPTEGPILLDMGHAPRSPSIHPSWSLTLYEAFMDYYQYGQSVHKNLSFLQWSYEDVKNVILTHLHVDHLGKWNAFPNATFWISKEAWQHAQSAFPQKHRIFPEMLPPPHRVKLFETPHTKSPLSALRDDEVFSPFEGVRIVALPGHAPGHCGVWTDSEKPVFYAADASYTLKGLVNNSERNLSRRITGHRFAQSEMSRQRVKDLFLEGTSDVVLCHDPNVSPMDAMNWDFDITFQNNNFIYPTPQAHTKTQN